MRLLALLPLAALLVVAAPSPFARADSWMPPRPMLDSSEDGRWYVIVEPVESVANAAFRLVKRAAGKPPRAPWPHTRAASGAPQLEPGDQLVARGPCTMPMEVRCLDGGRGFVLFETYAQIGSGRVIDVHDGKGKLRFSRSLPDLLSEARRATLTRSVSSIWWYTGWWIDEQAREIVMLWTGREDAGGVLRTRLADGTTRDGERTDVLARFTRGSVDERTDALEQALAWKVPGITSAAVAAFEDVTAPAVARLHFAKLLLERGDPRGRAFFAAQARDGALPARRFAVRHLPLALAEDALPLLEAAMRSEDERLRDSAEYALRHLGGKAVPTLIAMLGASDAPATCRAGAATALWNMPVEEALPAEDALAKAAQDTDRKVSYPASHALNRIREFKAKR